VLRIRSRLLLASRAAEVRRLPALAPPIAALAAARLPTVDLLHAHFGTFASTWTIAARRTRTPMVVSFYGEDASLERFHRPPWSGWYRRMFETAGAVLAEGPAMAARIGGLGCPDEKIAVVRLPTGWPVDPDPAVLDRAATGAPKAEYAAFLGGRFVEKKGFRVGIEAFASAFPSGPERLLVVGDGPCRADLEATADRCQVRDRVEFHPPAPMSEFAGLMDRACVVLFPSVTADNGDGEGGAPMSLPLAQARGRRVIITDHDDLPFAAAPGTPVVASGEVAPLAEALQAVVGEVRACDAAHPAQVWRAAQFVADVHDPERLLREREAVYSAALGR
jgi:glycosyltransferase involved in cell wall biosynthesis